MTVLRMLAFRPGQESGGGAREPDAGKGSEVRGPAAAREALASSPTRAAPTPPPAPRAAPVPPPPKSEPAPEPVRETPAHVQAPVPATHGGSLDASSWPDIAANLGLGGPAKELAAHAGFLGYENGVLRLSLSHADEHLKAEGLVKRLASALAPKLGVAPQIRFESEAARGETLHERTTRERDARQVAAEQAFLADPDVQRLMQRHGATLVPDSIRPVDEA
jgi:DNA polymerase-3 subunit gamma/tau